MRKRKKHIALRAKSPNVLLVNKPLIITVVIFIAFLLFFSIFYALHRPKKTLNDKTKSMPANSQLLENSVFKNLPDNYQNKQGINQFLPKTHHKTSQPSSDHIKKQTADSTVLNNKNLTNALQSNVFFNGLNPKKENSNAFANNHNANQNNSSLKNSTSNKESGYEKQNMQSQKIKFLRQKDDADDVYNAHALIRPISAYEIQAGAIIPAVIVTAINTSLPGVVIAQVTQNVFDTVTGKYLLIPKGSKIIGKYDSRIAYGQTRVLIAFNRVIMPNGNSIQLNNFNGSDMGGSAGFDGNVNNHWMRILGAATISTLLSVGTGIASNSYYSDNNYYPSPMQNALSAAGGSVASTGQQLTGRAMDVQPTITVPAGFEFNVIVNKDMVLEPYKQRNATL
jgi:type IV secretion system protein VirB10